MTPEEFREKLQESDAETILQEIVLADDAVHVGLEERDLIRSTIASTFSTPKDQVTMRIVGSAKLGFSLSERRADDGTVKLERYRPFRAESDIDVAVICPRAFNMIWHELAQFSHKDKFAPWKSGRLGDYLILGWLRPDHFPKARLRHCDAWNDCFNRLSADSNLGRRKIRGGLFHSMQHMQQYYIKSVEECIKAEEIA